MKIAVIGAGSWGITLARLLNEGENTITLWEFFTKKAEEIREERENISVLPGITIPDEILITDDIKTAVKDSEVLVIVVPSHVVRSTLNLMKEHLSSDFIIVSTSKGIEIDTGLRMSEVMREVIGDRGELGVLYGPTHAEEVSRRIPTTIVAGSENEETARKIQRLFMRDYFRVYTNTDVTGVEFGGSLKNIIAIAAGGIDGMGFGDNTKGALLTRGLAEITRFGVSFGANPLTFSGLSGLGDLITTCTSEHSRNRYVGEMLGRGMTIDEILSTMTMVAEGVKTTKAVYQISNKYNIEMPITEEVYRALYEGKNPRKVIVDLMTREEKSEQEFTST